jgi:hypothetical protein
MNKTRFLALTVVLGITSWVSLHPTVEAAPPPNVCSYYDGTTCRPQNATVVCWDPYAHADTYCICQPKYLGYPALAWTCYYR